FLVWMSEVKNKLLDALAQERATGTNDSDSVLFRDVINVFVELNQYDKELKDPMLQQLKSFYVCKRNELWNQSCSLYLGNVFDLIHDELIRVSRYLPVSISDDIYILSHEELMV